MLSTASCSDSDKFTGPRCGKDVNLKRGDLCESPQDTMEEVAAQSRDHIRAVQWAFAHHSMVVNCDEWVEDENEDSWDSDEDATSEHPSTPDWRDQFDKIVNEDVQRAKMKREQVCEALGAVTYLSPSGTVVAQQCANGGIWYEGERYAGVADWLRKCFSKRI